MQTIEAPALSNRVQLAVKADAAEEIMRLFTEELIAKQKAEAEAKAAAELFDLETRLAKNRLQDIRITKMAERAYREKYGDELPPDKSLGEFLQAAIYRNSNYLEKHYGSTLAVPDRSFWSAQQKTAMAESGGVSGGYTVPTEFYTQIMAVAAELGFVRSRAQIVTMTSATMAFPRLDVTSAQAADVSPFSGGLSLTWTTEGKTRTETEPQFKQLELRAWELSGQVVISRALIQDGVNLARYLTTLIGNAVAEYEEAGFLVGNGVGKPQGILGANATIPITRQTANAVTFKDVAGMLASLPPGSLEYACWTCSPTAIPQLLQLTDGTTRAVQLQAGVGETPARPRLMLGGLPLKVSQWCPALGTKGDLMLADWRYYVIGDRSLEIASSDAPNFTKNQATVRVVDRVDGQPWIDKAITLQDGVTQVSPFVVLN